MNQTEIIRLINNHVEKKANEWLQKDELDPYKAMWEFGKVKKDGTELERHLHQMVYERWSQKARAMILKNEKITAPKRQ